MPPSQTRIEAVEDAAELAQRAARWIADLAGASRGRFAICLSGGSTPRRLYQIAGRRTLSRGDAMGPGALVLGRRAVRARGTIRTAITAWRARRCSTHVPAPAQNVHGIETSGDPAAAAHAYERVLKAYYGAETLDPARPLFDIELLGLGPDGHTASLVSGHEGPRRTAALGRRGGRRQARGADYPDLPGARMQPAYGFSGGRRRQARASGPGAGWRPGAAGRTAAPGRRAGMVRRRAGETRSRTQPIDERRPRPAEARGGAARDRGSRGRHGAGARHRIDRRLCRRGAGRAGGRGAAGRRHPDIGADRGAGATARHPDRDLCRISTARHDDRRRRRGRARHTCN